MKPQNEQHLQAGKHPGIMSEITAAATGGAAAFGTLKLGNKLFSKHNVISRGGTIAAAVVAGFGIGNVVYRLLHKKPHKGEFSGFSPQNPPTSENASAYVNYTKQVAESGNLGALDTALEGMERAGLGHVANALRRHRADPANEKIYATVDAWLTELGDRSPETFAHIQRELVMLALFVDSVDYSGPQQLRDGLIARVIMAGIIHDIGKMAISPELLHKDARIPHVALSEHIAAYDAQVFEYPEKALHEDFLRAANGGLIPFGDSSAQPTMNVEQVLAAVRENPLLSEPEYASPELLASTAAIYQRIRTRAQNAGIAWLPPEQEAALLNHNRRGTLSQKEMALMDAHDEIGNAMSASAGINQALAIDPAIVNVKLPDNHLSAEDKALRDMVHMTDLYEATTGERAYNAHNGKDFSHANAMQLLAHEATNGRIAPQNLAAFERAHIAERFQAIETGIASLTPAATVHTSTAQQHSLQLTPATSLA